VYRHWMFKVIVTALLAVVGFAALGVFKFYNITVNVKEEILAKEVALNKELENQKKDMDAFQGNRSKEMEALSLQLSGLSSNLTDAKKGIAQLETEAQGTLARFASQVGRMWTRRLQRLWTSPRRPWP